MKEPNGIARLLFPLIRNLPIVLVVVGLFAGGMNLYLKQVEPTYEAVLKMILANKMEGPSGSDMYKNFDYFSSNNFVLTEIELLKSKELSLKALKKVPFDVEYNRIGSLKEVEMYDKSPFELQYYIKDSTIYGKPILMSVSGGQNLKVNYEINENKVSISGNINQVLNTPHLSFKLVRTNLRNLSQRNDPINGQFKLVLRTTENAYNVYIAQNLDVSNKEKEVPLVRIVLKSSVPQKSADFVNALAETYIEDYIEQRNMSASKTYDFIDKQLSVIYGGLKNIEDSTEFLKNARGITNLTQESETYLRQISELKIQENNISTQKVSIDTLKKYANSPQEFLDKAINYEAYSDLLSTELNKKIKDLQIERRNLLLKYTTEHPAVKIIDKKIDELAAYLIEAINNSAKNMDLKNKRIKTDVTEAKKQLDKFPTKEKEMNAMEREYKLKEKAYAFLVEKQLEAQLAKASNFSFHRVIERADPPLYPTYPKKSLMYVLAIFLGLITSIMIVFLISMLRNKVLFKRDIEEISANRVLGVVLWDKKRPTISLDDFSPMAMQLVLLQKKLTNKSLSIAITSTKKQEGKSFVAYPLAKSLALQGYNTMLIDLNFRNPTLHKTLKLKNLGINDAFASGKDWNSYIQDTNTPRLHALLTGTPQKQDINEVFGRNKFEKMQQQINESYDFVIFDLPPILEAWEVPPVLQTTNVTLWVTRSDYSDMDKIEQIDLLANELQIPKLFFVLNGKKPLGLLAKLSNAFENLANWLKLKLKLKMTT